MKYNEMRELAGRYGVPVAEEIGHHIQSQEDWTQLYNILRNDPDHEGFVIRLRDSSMYKLKTFRYLGMFKQKRTRNLA
jgi:hypothetical protein